mmetsp:Transcript_20649/g.57034  ORF Transcript_20649/g.57034 Transcript_20649/m.57034 type:complete len:384 (-) Transcript_20649:260-1411(-)
MIPMQKVLNLLRHLLGDATLVFLFFVRVLDATPAAAHRDDDASDELVHHRQDYIGNQQGQARQDEKAFEDILVGFRLLGRPFHVSFRFILDGRPKQRTHDNGRSDKHGHGKGNQGIGQTIAGTGHTGKDPQQEQNNRHRSDRGRNAVHGVRIIGMQVLGQETNHQQGHGGQSRISPEQKGFATFFVDIQTLRGTNVIEFHLHLVRRRPKAGHGIGRFGIHAFGKFLVVNGTTATVRVVGARGRIPHVLALTGPVEKEPQQEHTLRDEDAVNPNGIRVTWRRFKQGVLDANQQEWHANGKDAQGTKGRFRHQEQERHAEGDKAAKHQNFLEQKGPPVHVRHVQETQHHAQGLQHRGGFVVIFHRLGNDFQTHSHATISHHKERR